MQAELHDPSLGTLVLGTDPYVVTSIAIGSPNVRENTRDVALGDGERDDSLYLGGRAITVATRLKGNLRSCPTNDMQGLIDAVTPYMHPRLRPTLTWQLPGSAHLRAAIVRGVNWPYTISAPRAPILPLQFKCPSGEILAGAAGGASAQICEIIRPSADVEEGRTYDLTFDRSYPPSEPIGSREITNPGNNDTHWVLTIFGPVTDPAFTINGIAVEFTGLMLLAGQNVVIDTRRRTALFDNNPLDSRYNLMNYNEWGWHDIELQPGTNVVRFDGTGIDEQTSAEMCFTPSFL